jgi:hypothetical protein
MLDIFQNTADLSEERQSGFAHRPQQPLKMLGFPGRRVSPSVEGPSAPADGARAAPGLPKTIGPENLETAIGEKHGRKD